MEGNSYLIDSGANVSMTNDRSILKNYQKIASPLEITSSNGGKTFAYGSGSVTITCNPPITITNVLFAPKITKTLLATKSFTEQGFTVVIQDQLKIINQQGDTMIRAEERNGLHYINVTQDVESHSSITLEQAHRRFGHASDQRLKHISTSADGIMINGKERNFCEDCAHGKSRGSHFPKSAEQNRTDHSRSSRLT